MLIYQQVEQISLTRVVNCKCFPKTDIKFKMVWKSNILYNCYCLLILSHCNNIYIILLCNSFILEFSVNSFENIKVLYWDIISDFYTSTCSFRYMIEFTELSSTHVQSNSWPGKLAQHS